MRRHLLVISAVLAILSHGVLAHAQDAPVPLPEPITAPAEPAALTIERPAAGESVKTPFTVEGRAPRGARLELWIGERLDRVFQSNADGLFSAPVATEVPPETEIFVHQIDPDGRRIRSTSVMVNWSGERPEQKVTRSEAVGTQSAGESAEIPRTANADLETLEFAPSPPPLGAPTAPDATEGAVTTTDAGATAATTVRERKPFPRGLRAIAEAGGGFGVGIVGAGIFGAIGLGLGLMTAREGFAALGTRVIGGVVGYAAGIGVGVTAVGYALDGNGKVWAVILGELAGIAGGVAIAAASASLAPNGDGTIIVLSLATLPIVGAVLGFELTSDPSRRAAKEASTASVVPFFAPTHDGALAVGPALRLAF